MTARKGIAEICDGRAAIVPAVASTDNNLSDGAYRLYGFCCGHADAAGNLVLELKAYAARRKVATRTAQRWKVELESQGYLVEIGKYDMKKQPCRIMRTPAERLKAVANNKDKVAKRKRAKTTLRSQLGVPATQMSHIENKILNRTPLIPPCAKKRARQGEPPQVGPPSQGELRVLGDVNQRHQPHLRELAAARQQTPQEPDWNGWADWLRDRWGMTVAEALNYIIVQTDAIKMARAVSVDEAWRLLDACMRASRAADAHPAQWIADAVSQRLKA